MANTRTVHLSSIGPSHQRGIALLLLLLVAVTAGSMVILRSLNIAAANRSDHQETITAVLMEAKSALIGYAVNTPELTGGSGPGRLPCPDLTGNGSAAGSCSAGGINPTTGWFPHVELGLGELRDSSGARLWYAVADSHRYFLTAPINSDTGDDSDDLSLNNVDAIVALIIAPGAALGGQNRTGVVDITDYLEAENASSADADTSNDTEFSSTTNALRNDRVIAITREELMRAVEKRVIGNVSNSLNQFFTDYGGYPWAAPFTDPVTKSDYAGVQNIREGQIPIHLDGETVDVPLPSIFAWDVNGGTISPGTAPRDDCVRNTECDDDDADINTDFSGLPFSSKSCVWSNAESFNCTAVRTVTVTDGKPLTRTYVVNISGLPPEISLPTASVPRSRKFPSISSLPPNASGTLRVEDVLDGAMRGRRSISLASGDSVNIDIEGVRFKIGDDASEVANRNSSPGGLPRWFTENLWHRYVYFAFSPSDSLSDPSTCNPGTNCLTLQVKKKKLPLQSRNNIRGLAIISGRAVNGLPRAATVSGYFESENASVLDSVFYSSAMENTYSDQVVILGTVP